jgi:restriction endonuclease S subunit
MESLEVPTLSLSEQHRIVANLDSVQTQTAALKRIQEDPTPNFAASNERS